MRFSDLSSDAKQHALAALGILISGASQVDIVSSKVLGEGVAAAFIAMERFDSTPDESDDIYDDGRSGNKMTQDGDQNLLPD
ncbi:hypothetical protein MAK22_000223 [Klebsiella aerogenes]|nr:hypothetical protein [Klebsiella aerogenes]EIV7211136.1 hypothetical protein [Klebsiella aerogenes]EKZ5298623.1 hypothetical protein [Klebsiella aerogenes]